MSHDVRPAEDDPSGRAVGGAFLAPPSSAQLTALVTQLRFDQGCLETNQV